MPSRSSIPAVLQGCLSFLLNGPTASPVLWIGYSGGCDSSVLLHALHDWASGRQARVQAVHVNHQLHPRAAEWAEFCAQQCARCGIPLRIIEVDARPLNGKSPEAWARQLRYNACRALLGAGDCFLTAHHQDDQAETVLLQLLRGGGVRGLAAMPERAPLGDGWHLRPFLSCPRADLIEYAQAQGLQWLDDPSNADTGYDRNYLRHEIMPRLHQRWPAVDQVMARAARWQAEAAALMDEMAAADLEHARGPRPQCLSVAALCDLSPLRCAQVLRVWLKSLALPVPHAAHLAQISRDLLHARRDGQGCVRWPGAEVRRHRDLLYAAQHAPAGDDDLESTRDYPWDPARPLQLPWGRLSAHKTKGVGLAARWVTQQGLHVRRRRGGEVCRPAWRNHRQSLKKLLQEAGVPPWQRERLPLIYCSEKLAAVADLWVCHPWQAAADEAGWVFRWEPDNTQAPRGDEQ